MRGAGVGNSIRASQTVRLQSADIWSVDQISASVFGTYNCAYAMYVAALAQLERMTERALRNRSIIFNH